MLYREIESLRLLSYGGKKEAVIVHTWYCSVVQSDESIKADIGAMLKKKKKDVTASTGAESTYDTKYQAVG